MCMFDKYDLHNNKQANAQVSYVFPNPIVRISDVCHNYVNTNLATLSKSEFMVQTVHM